MNAVKEGGSEVEVSRFWIFTPRLPWTVVGFVTHTVNGLEDIKGRACTDDRKKPYTIKKEDAVSPTVDTESLFTTSSVEAHEGQHVATFGIPGAYLNTETDKGVIMSLEGALAQLIVKVAPKIYCKYVIISIKRKMLLYVQIKKVLYGLICSKIFFYRKLVKDIETHGFDINPY